MSHEWIDTALKASERPLAVQLVEVAQEIARKEEELAKLKREAEALNRQLLDWMTEQGLQNMHTTAGQTLFIRRELYVNKKGGIATEEVCARLRAAGLEDFVKSEESYNANTLKSYVKELDKAKQERSPGDFDPAVLPEQLRDVLNVYEEHVVQIRGLNGQSKS